MKIQLCIIHQIKNTTKYISYKDIKEFCKDLKTIYTAIYEKTALENLEKMEDKWWKNYWYAFNSWKDNWAELSTMFAYSEEN